MRSISERPTLYSNCTIATDYSYVKCSRTSIAKILHDELEMQKVSTHSVPQQFLKTHLDQQRTAALTFLALYQEQGNLLLYQIVTGDLGTLLNARIEINLHAVERERGTDAAEIQVCVICWKGSG